MESINPKVKKKAKEIVGDSTGIEAAQKIAEWAMENSSYKVYETPGRCGKTFKQQLEFERRNALNCSDCNISEEDYKDKQRIIKKLQELQEQRRLKQ